MQLTFSVGDLEKHTVCFSFDQMWGALKITVDGEKVVNTVRTFSIDLVKAYEFTVGVEEQHLVRIEKRRERFFAGFRPQVVTAWVDYQLTAEGVSAVTRPLAISALAGGLVVLAIGIVLIVVNLG